MAAKGLPVAEKKVLDSVRGLAHTYRTAGNTEAVIRLRPQDFAILKKHSLEARTVGKYNGFEVKVV